jgi:hypothetical protein
VEAAALHPNTADARALTRVILPLLVMTGQKVQYGSVGANSSAFAAMRNYHRFFGHGGWFITVNPVLSDLALPLRLSQPVTDNHGDICGLNFQMPDSFHARKTTLRDNPTAAALGYLWFRFAFHRTFLGMDFPRPGESPLSRTQIPPPHRRRGIYGDVVATYGSEETSGSGAQHMHLEALGPVTWPFIRDLVHVPENNEAFGRYFESIACSSLEYGPNGWDALNSLTWSPPAAQEPSPRYAALQARHAVCCTIMDHRWHNKSCFKRMQSSQPQASAAAPSAVRPTAEAVGLAVARHAGTSAPLGPLPTSTAAVSAASATVSSCSCRFAMPRFSHHQQCGFCQLNWVRAQQTDDVQPTVSSRRANGADIRIRYAIEAPPEPGSRDERIISLLLSRPVSGDRVLRTFRALADRQAPSPDAPLFLDADPVDANSWLTEHNDVVLLYCNAQNNLQFIAEGGFGTEAYIAKYIVKSEIGLGQSYSLLVEAIRTAELRPSRAPDADTNEARPALRLLQRLLNNHVRATELPVQLIASVLLGMKQFHGSHPTSNVWLGSAVAYQHGLRAQSYAPSSAATEESLRDDADDVHYEEHVREEDAAEVAPDSEGNAVFVTSVTDYVYRDRRLAGVSFMEFACLFKKVTPLTRFFSLV